jgi:hypothetical protein
MGLEIVCLQWLVILKTKTNTFEHKHNLQSHFLNSVLMPQCHPRAVAPSPTLNFTVIFVSLPETL